MDIITENIECEARGCSEKDGTMCMRDDCPNSYERGLQKSLNKTLKEKIDLLTNLEEKEREVETLRDIKIKNFEAAVNLASKYSELKAENNKLELRAEDADCADKYLDDINIPRKLGDNEYSLVGRIGALKAENERLMRVVEAARKVNSKHKTVGKDFICGLEVVGLHKLMEALASLQKGKE